MGSALNTFTHEDDYCGAHADSFLKSERLPFS